VIYVEPENIEQVPARHDQPEKIHALG